jgi:hypothetical protein
MVHTGTAVEIAKAIVRSASPDARVALWEALTKGISEARDSMRVTGSAMPWEQDEEITVIAWADLQDVVCDCLNSVILDSGERRRLAQVAIRAAGEITAEAVGSTRPLKAGRYGIRVCARPGCGQRFTAKSPRHIWHSSTCRAAAHKAARRAAERATGQAPAT